jgi:hypothetical protein
MIGLHTCGCAGGNWPACMRITATLAATGVVPYSRTHRSKLPYFWYLLLQHGHTPLLLAAQQGHPEVVGMLLDSGAAGDARNTVRSPLELAEGSRLGPQLHAIGASTSGWAGCADVKNKASCVCTRVLSSEKLGSGHLMHGSELWMGCMQCGGASNTSTCKSAVGIYISTYKFPCTLLKEAIQVRHPCCARVGLVLLPYHH